MRSMFDFKSVQTKTNTLENFVKKRIGKGTYGEVFRITDRRTNERFAFKRVKINTTTDEDDFYYETKIYEDLNNSPYICKMHKAIKECNQIGFILELKSYDLFWRLHNNIYPFNLCDIKRTLYSVAKGLLHMHSKGYIHGDVKPANILLDTNDKNPVITDFSLTIGKGMSSASYSKMEKCTLVYTPHYRPPEIHLYDSYFDETSDIWALGVVFLEMILRSNFPMLKISTDVNKYTNRYLYCIFSIFGLPNSLRSNNEQTEWPLFNKHVTNARKIFTIKREKKEKIHTLFNPFYLKSFFMNFNHTSFKKVNGYCIKKVIDVVGPCGLDLMKKMLCYDPKKRCNGADVLSHPFLSEYVTTPDCSPQVRVCEKKRPILGCCPSLFL
jgi:serine/threonine protein kinase